MERHAMALELEQFDPGPGAAPVGHFPEILSDASLSIDAAYLHVPFCFHKCHYCDFYSIVDTGDRQARFVDRIEDELRTMAGRIDGAIGAVFLGGGTPTLLEPELLGRLLEAVGEHLPLEAGVEWTVEANPETIDEEVASRLAQGGVNRISIGCQSFRPRLLEVLERHHDPDNVARAIDRLRSAGIDAFNLDLIHGIPGSTFDEWCLDLEDALALEPEHLSCYGLQYEPNTPLTKKLELGRIERLDEDLEADMYEHTCSRLGAAGFRHYEISNWSRPGAECRHNLVYWRSGNWLAFGPSASGHVDGTRWKNVPRLTDWLDSGPGTPVVDLERVDASARVGEHLMLELRLREGITRQRLDELLGRSDPDGRRRAVIEDALSTGLMLRESDCLRLSDRGVLLADSLLSELI